MRKFYMRSFGLKIPKENCFCANKDIILKVSFENDSAFFFQVHYVK